MRLLLSFIILFIFTACVGIDDKVKIKLADKSAVLSYAGSTGRSGLVGVAMTVTPTSLVNAKSPVTSCVVLDATPALPSWAYLNNTTCVISGVPTAGLSAKTFYIVATNALGLESVASVQLSVGVSAPTTFVRTTPVTIIGINPTPTFTISGGGVAAGVIVKLYSNNLCTSLVGTAISGGSSVPITTSTLTDNHYTFYANVTNAGVTSSCSSVSINYILDTQQPLWANSISLSASSTSLTTSPVITYVENATDTSGSGIPLTNAYQYSIGTTSGGVDIKGWTSTGGTPFTAGSLTLVVGNTYYLNMRAVDSGGLYSSVHTVSWLVASAPSLSFAGATGTIMNRGTVMNVVPTTLSAGASATITGCATSGTLPAGITVNASTCAVSGAPEALLGATIFPVTVTNSFSQTFTANVTLTVTEGWIDTDAAALAGSQGRKGVNWSGSNLVLAADTDCDGNTSEGETIFTNCSELDASWTPHYSSIVSYWKLNNNLNDSIGSHPLVAAGGTPGFIAAGKVGSHAVDLSSGVYAVTNSVVTDRTTDVTMGGWYYWTGLQSWQSLFYNGTGAGNGYGIMLSNGNCDSGSKITLLTGQVSCSGLTGTPQDMPQNEWIYIVLTRSGATWSLYLNGMLTQTGTANAYTPTGRTDLAGTAGATFNVRIDDFAIWNASLSASDVQLIYQRQAPKYSGEFSSRIFDASSANTWEGFKWMTDLPYGKELPGESGSESSMDYSAIIDSTIIPGVTEDLMTGLKGYWRLNEPAGTTGADSIRDSSGNGFHGAPVGGVVLGGEGKFGGAAQFDALTGYVDLGTSNDMAITTGELTSSIWVYLNKVNGRAYGNYDAGSFQLGDFDLRIESNLLMIEIAHDSGGGNGYQCTKLFYTLKTKAWTHLVVVYSEIAGDIKMYVDGELLPGLSNCTLSYGHTTLLNSVLPLYIGGTPIAAAGIDGLADEFAIWSRALSSAEIKQLYLRGANKIKFQTRSCTDATCSSNPPWLGFAGTPGIDNSNVSYISEIHNNLSPTVIGVSSGDVILESPDIFFATLTSLNGLQTQQYFQYRAILESYDEGTSCGGSWCNPKLQQVEVKP